MFGNGGKLQYAESAVAAGDRRHGKDSRSDARPEAHVRVSEVQPPVQEVYKRDPVPFSLFYAVCQAAGRPKKRDEHSLSAIKDIEGPFQAERIFSRCGWC